MAQANLKVCLFKYVGCPFVGNFSQYGTHLIQELFTHQMYLREHYTYQRGQINEIACYVEERSSLLYTLRERVREQEAAIHHMENIILPPLRKASSDLNVCACRVEQKVKHMGGGYLWKIPEFTQRINKKERFETTFYTSELGYKMRFIFNHPNVCNNYIPFFSVMCGAFDEQVTWPFKGRVIINAVKTNDKGGIISGDYPSFERSFKLKHIGCESIVPIYTFVYEEVLEFIENNTMNFFIRILIR